MHALIRAGVVLAAIVTGGCASTMHTSSLPAEVPATTEVDGIPYFEREQMQVELYELGPRGYELRDAKTVMMANPTVVHVQNFKGQSFADSSLKVVQRTDGSLTSVTLTGDGKAAEAMTSISDGLTSLQAAQKAQDAAEKAQQVEADAELAAIKAKGDAAVQAVYAATKARGEARVLELEYSQLPANTSASVREAKRNEMVLAKLRANIAAVAAGQPIPYAEPESDAEG